MGFDEQIRDEVEQYLGLPVTAVTQRTSQEEVSERIAVDLAPLKAAGPDRVLKFAPLRLPKRDPGATVQTAAFFINVAKTFDCSWHEVLLFKLKEIIPTAKIICSAPF